MQTLEELHAHYKAVRARLDCSPFKKKEPNIRLVYSTLGPYQDPLDVIEEEPIIEEPEPVVEVDAKFPEITTETPARIVMREVAEKHGLPISVLRSKDRAKEYVFCRQEASFRLYTELGFSLSQVGRMLGNRDHTTVLHAIKRYKKNLAQGTGPWASKLVSGACPEEAETQAQHDHG